MSNTNRPSKVITKEGSTTSPETGQQPEANAAGLVLDVREDLKNMNNQETAEVVDHNLELATYSKEYADLPDEVKRRASWEAIVERLLDNGGEKLKLAKGMQGEAQLFGVDVEGRALFKDRGEEPVMFGFDEEGELLKIYDRDPKQMKQVKKWANYFEIREQVLADEYELFTPSSQQLGARGRAEFGARKVGLEMAQFTHNNKGLFVGGLSTELRPSWLEGGDSDELTYYVNRRSSWLEGGDSPDDWTYYIYYCPDFYNVTIGETRPVRDYEMIGAVRLLRV